MTAAQLLEALRKADLSHYYLNFTMQGVNTLDALLSIAPTQLQSLGIQSESDQQRLLELIRSLRSSHGLMKQASSSVRMNDGLNFLTVPTYLMLYS